MIAFRMLGILGLLVLAACGTAPERRWSEVQYRPEQPPLSGGDGNLSAYYMPKLMVTSYATSDDVKTVTSSDKAPVGNGKGLSLKDLSDHGQSSLVDSLEKLIAAEDPTCGSAEKKAPPPPCRHVTLLDALGISSSDGQSSDKGPPALGSVDATSFKRTIVINVLNGTDLPPGDRLQQFTVQVQPTPSSIRFTDYSIAQTQSANSKFGTVTQTTQMNLSGKIDPTHSSAVKGTGEASAGYSNQKVVTSDITEAIVPLNVDIQNGALFVQKRGSAVTDISGNTLIALTVIVPTNDSHSALTVRQQTLFKNAAPLSPDAAALAVDFTRFAQDDVDVTATVSLDYLLRHVESGASTYIEGDDSVTFYRGKVEATKVTLIPKAEIVGDKWGVIVQYATPDNPSCEELKATPFGFKPGTSVPIYFSDEVSARSFVTWLSDTKATDINAHQLTFKINQSAIDWAKSPTVVVVTRAAWETNIRASCQHTSQVSH